MLLVNTANYVWRIKKIIKKIRTDQEHLRLENEKNLRTSRQPKFTGSCIKDGTCNIQTNYKSTKLVRAFDATWNHFLFNILWFEKR